MLKAIAETSEGHHTDVILLELYVAMKNMICQVTITPERQRYLDNKSDLAIIESADTWEQQLSGLMIFIKKFIE